MKFTIGLLVWLGTAQAFTTTPRSAFIPKNIIVTNKKTRTNLHAASSMTMLVESSGGMVELVEYTEQQGPSESGLAKKVIKSPKAFKMVGMATIPLSAVLGLSIGTAVNKNIRLAAALVSGLGGLVGKSRIDAFTRNAAKPALAQVLVDYGIDNPSATSQQLSKVQTDFGLDDDEMGTLCSELYATYLLGMIKYSTKAKTSELKELEQLKAALGLDNLQVGQAHAQAAKDWYEMTVRTIEADELDDPTNAQRQAMDKLLFLTERALANETPQAFVFEMTRVAKNLHLSNINTAKERVASVVEPFYQRALQSVRNKLDEQVSSEMLERARNTLGLSDETAFDMHVAAYNAEVKELLGIQVDTNDDDDDDDDEEEDVPMDYASMKFPEDAKERLDRLQEILELYDEDAQYEIALEATPLYQATALAAMQDVLEGEMSPDEAWQIMEGRREELLMSEKSSRELVSSMVMQALGKPLEETNKYAKVNNEKATFENVLNALEAKEALLAILSKSGWDEYDKFDETFCSPWNKQSACGFMNSEERLKIYRIFVRQSVRLSDGNSLSEDAYQQIMEVKGLLGITDQQAEIEARGAFGPELKKVLKSATDEIVQDYTPELASNMQSEIDAVVKNYRLSDDFLREVGATFYSGAVNQINQKAPGGIPTKEMTKALSALRDLFKLNLDDVSEFHMEAFGTVYKKSVLEAMGTTGVIRPEFRDSLQVLRERIGVSEENCHKLYLEAVEEKMEPMVKWIGSEMERTMLSQKQLSQRRGKDVGEDVFQSGKGADGVLGLGADVNIMSDINELIDFYVENDIMTTGETGKQSVEKTKMVDGKETAVMEEETTTGTIYPITALGMGAIDQEMAELLYRQFLVSSFTATGEQGARLDKNRDIFAGILGLSSDKIAEVSKNIGSTVYENVIKNAMQTKGTMDQQDMMMIANVQSKLGISDEKSEKLLLDTQKKILTAEVNELMDNDPTPDRIRAFREKCNSMGVDLAKDIGVSKTRLARMFEAELTPALKSGQVSADDYEILGDIQDSLGIEPDECETMFENLLMRLSKNAVDVIKGELLRGREDNTVDLINELVRYAGFTGGDLGIDSMLDEATANKVYNLYDTFDHEQEKDTVEENKELLKIALGLSKQ